MSNSKTDIWVYAQWTGMADPKMIGILSTHPLETTYTNLPGLKGIPVIISYPLILKENSSKPVDPIKRK